MSLLDDVSIVVTPNGYKAGELYAVVPVPTEGAELITNGDFATDSNWNLSSGLTFSAGAILFDDDNDNLFQNWTNTVNTLYKLTITKTGSGTLRFRSGYAGSAGVRIDIPESGIIYFTSTSDTNRIQIYGDISDVSATLNSVSVKEYTAADMDVTRATAATRVDEAGLVNYAEIIGSEEVTNGDFSNGLNNWTVEGATSYASIVNGALNSNNTNAGNWYAEHIEQDISFVNGTTYKVTFKAKNISGNLNLRITQNATVITSENLTDSFVDYSVLYTANLTGGSIRLFCNSAVGQFEVDDISVKEVTRDNVPRIDYTGGGCPHILAEPQRTNLLPYSEDFSQSSWIKSSQTVSLSAILSPNGTSFAYKLTATADYSKIRQDVNLSATTTYTVSFYTKNISAANPRILAYDQNNAVNLLNKFYGSELSNSEWVRITGTFTTTTASTIQIQINRDLMNSEEMLIYGAQLEEGSYPTSIIPTSGNTVTRNQDIFTRDGIGSLINSEEGVLFLEAAALVKINPSGNITLTDGSGNNRLYIYYLVDNSISVIYNINSTGAVINNFSLTDITQQTKIAVKWGNSNVSVYINGNSVLSTATSNFLPNTLNQLSFSKPSGTVPFEGKVKQLQVYKTALTDTQLAALTS